MTEDRGLDLSETIIETADADYGAAPVLLAQADTGSEPVETTSSTPAAPEMSVVVPDADNRVSLRDSVSIEDIRVDGNDLLLIQPDGSQVRVIGGAFNVPTFVIGEIEIPQEVLVAALNTNGFNVAAGPGNTVSVVPQAPEGSGGDFEDSGDASIGGDGNESLDLLGDTSGEAGEAAGASVVADTGNVAAIFSGGTIEGDVEESEDNPGGVDEDPDLSHRHHHFL